VNKKTLSLLLSTSILISYPLISYSQIDKLKNIKMSSIVDVKPKHWAYEAVKYVMEDLDIMEPKTSTRFMGDKKATRYELARVFYFALQSLENISEKQLKIVQDSSNIIITDVDDNNKDLVRKIVSEYGLMQLMPDNKFMGNREMTRYELAFDLNNYLRLLENKVGDPKPPLRTRSSELSDLSTNHWAYTAVVNIIDKYRIMDGYPQNVFGGNQKLTRYEVAALLKRFIEYVDTKIFTIPSPTPTPTPIPMPTSTPIPTPTPIPKKLSKFDIKFGGGSKSLMNNPSNNTLDPAINLDLVYWFSRFGVAFNTDYSFSDYQFPIKNSSRFNSSLTLNYKLLEQLSNEDTHLSLGLGYGLTNWSGTLTDINGNNLSNIISHGPKISLNFELPFAEWIALNVNNSFTYMTFGNNGFRNDLFAGFNLPAYSLFSFQLGYTNTLYSINNVSGLNIQNGLQGNFRFKF